MTTNRKLIQIGNERIDEALIRQWLVKDGQTALQTLNNLIAALKRLINVSQLVTEQDPLVEVASSLATHLRNYILQVQTATSIEDTSRKRSATRYSLKSDMTLQIERSNEHSKIQTIINTLKEIVSIHRKPLSARKEGSGIGKTDSLALVHSPLQRSSQGRERGANTLFARDTRDVSEVIRDLDRMELPLRDIQAALANAFVCKNIDAELHQPTL